MVEWYYIICKFSFFLFGLHFVWHVFALRRRYAYMMTLFVTLADEMIESEWDREMNICVFIYSKKCLPKLPSNDQYLLVEWKRLTKRCCHSHRILIVCVHVD